MGLGLELGLELAKRLTSGSEMQTTTPTCGGGN